MEIAFILIKSYVLVSVVTLLSIIGVSYAEIFNNGTFSAGKALFIFVISVKASFIPVKGQMTLCELCSKLKNNKEK